MTETPCTDNPQYSKLIKLLRFKSWGLQQADEFGQAFQDLQLTPECRQRLLNNIAAHHMQTDQFSSKKRGLREALIRFGGDAVQLLSEQVEDSIPDETRRSATIALGGIPHPDTIPVLLRYVEDRDYWVAMYAVEGLARKKDPRVVEPFLKLLDGHRWRQLTGVETKFHMVSVDIATQIRFAVAEALANMGETRVFTHLLEMTSDTGIARYAVNALGKLLDQNPAGLSDQELQNLVELKDLYHKPDETDYVRGYYTDKLEPVACTNLNRKAADELARRTQTK